MKYTKFNVGDIVFMDRSGGNDSGHHIYNTNYALSKGPTLYTVTEIVKNNDWEQENKFQYTLILENKYPVWASHCKLADYDIY
jgi:hypothetical protein